MKNILIALSSVAVMLLSSCGKDFITVRHNSSEPLAEYFINEERMYQGLMAAYDPLEWFDYFYQYNNLNFVSDIMADDIYCGGSNEGDQPILVKTHYFTATSIDCCNQIWTIAYSGINRACVVLEYVDGVPGMSDQTKARYKAEATVLKAYYYTLLWKFWGNIPYYDKNLETPYLTAQLGHDEVYEKIVTRLQEAIDMNILPMKVAAGEEGRVSLAMAYMLYAEAVMYQNDQTRYQTALDYMKEIISAGSYSLVDDYAGIWLESGEWCGDQLHFRGRRPLVGFAYRHRRYGISYPDRYRRLLDDILGRLGLRSCRSFGLRDVRGGRYTSRRRYPQLGQVRCRDRCYALSALAGYGLLPVEVHRPRQRQPRLSGRPEHEPRQQQPYLPLCRDSAQRSRVVGAARSGRIVVLAAGARPRSLHRYRHFARGYHPGAPQGVRRRG